MNKQAVQFAQVFVAMSPASPETEYRITDDESPVSDFDDPSTLAAGWRVLAEKRSVECYDGDRQKLTQNGQFKCLVSLVVTWVLKTTFGEIN